ncbi:hypothetical protein OE88DRAFT_1692235 [Heliocybe sulcata]|uniref:Membrane anchor Opy2 N-terminal domain-containing protein n=1 Tax=Heliocybe sulcata TaxID=5364 RepID=A0A5C3NHW5_9AGAM|nr:hypothetical protein OE88DRAFT_1692235 [Heliocybe sulcata]
MDYHVFLPRQTDGCPFVADCGDAPACNCSENEDCIQIGRTCTTCPTVQCIPKSSNSGSKGSGVSKGSLAGAIVGVMLFLAIAAVFFVWYRRRWLRQRAAAKTGTEVKEVPAAAVDVLNRPDPNEKPPSVMQEPSTVRVYSSASDGTIDLDPESQGGHNSYRRTSTQSNPFEDRHSIQTMSTGSQATNVIPIALVPPGSSASSLSGPARPTRSADLDLNLEHANVSNDSVSANYAASERSGASNPRRVSAMTSATNASYASDFMEAPTIITPTKGNIRQVLGVVKAEVIQAPGSLPSTPTSSNSLKPQSVTSRPSVRSPLATTSFGPSDDVKESDESSCNDPFSDQRSFNVPQQSPSASVTTFGTPPSSDPTSSHFDGTEPRLPWAQSGGMSRPTSVTTQAGTIIAELGSVTRVHLGLGEASPSPVVQPPTPNSADSKTIHRMTSGRLVSPPSGNKPGVMEEQQLHALVQAEALAKAQGLETGNNFHRFSGSSAVSRASTRADSILESFPFVPPSPISDRPARTPPQSPLAKEAFAKDKAANATDADTSSKQGHGKSRSRATNPPTSSRRTLGLSTVSQASAMSTGLGSFPFQIDSMDPPEHSPAPSSQFAGRQRASLDTLALTSDLSSYPLGFDQDRNSFAPSGTLH